MSIGALAISTNLKVFENKIKINTQNINTSYFDLIFVLLMAFAWEALEHYLEIGLLGLKVEYWFQGVEFWANRIFSDPLVTVFGYYVAKKNMHLVTPARLISLIWLLVHIFVFPHSMYLHEIL